MVIAIDGPAGAGKSTVAKRIAQKLGFLYIDTGAMYRALTLKAMREYAPLEDEAALARLAAQARIRLVSSGAGALKVFLGEEDVSEQIRKPAVTKYVSEIARLKAVREVMLGLQRQLGQGADCVVDGRDIGTVVFPDAEKKFYLDAGFKERGMRRYKELREKGEAVSLQDIEADVANRDRIDSTREVAPLKQAADAVYIDTTQMTIEEVVAKVLEYCTDGHR
jgi:cytidylate kinase